jgi:hypothetical protein
MFFEEIVAVISIVEALEGSIEIVKRKRVAAILKKDKASKGESSIGKCIRA